MIDEGPSDDDIRRFGDETEETAICPDCGAEVWDQADVCPQCGQFMVDGPSRQSRTDKRLDHRWIVILVVLLIIVLSGIAVFVL